MNTRPFRFLHAGQFHLESSLRGIADVPDHLSELLADAPRLAAKEVFSAAIEHRVDFLVLTGDLLDLSQATPRDLTFLDEQFRRLKEAGITIYLAAGRFDSAERIANLLELPDNVHVFPQGKPHEMMHRRDGEAICLLVGESHAGGSVVRCADFSAESGGVPAIAVAYGKVESEALDGRGICYWALGGQTQHTPIGGIECIAMYCGSPQGLDPNSAGPHGAVLVEVQSDGKPLAELLACDAVRWHNERLELSATATVSEFEHRLQERTRLLVNSASNRPALVSWQVLCAGSLATLLRQKGLGAEVLQTLQAGFGHHTPPLWTLSINPQIAGDFPSQWYEEETILGDFLRAMRKIKGAPIESLELGRYLPDGPHAGDLAASLRRLDTQAAARTMRMATQLGADLLRPQDTTTHNRLSAT